MIRTPLNLAMLGDPSAEQFCDILGLADTFAPLTDDGCGPPSPSFSYFAYDAATYELDDTLASGRVAVINVPDADGVYQQVATTKVAYVGARHSGGKQYADNGSGVLLDPQPYALSMPAGENVAAPSEAASWSATPTFGTGTRVADRAGLFGPTGGATLSDTSAASIAQWRASFASPAAVDVLGAVFWVEKDTDQTRFPACGVGNSTPGTYFQSKIQINTQTGDWVVVEQVRCSLAAAVVSDGIWWKVCVLIIDTGGVDNTGTYIDFIPAHNTVWGAGGGGVATTQGSVRVAFRQFMRNPPSIESLKALLPIVTTSPAVARDKDVIAAPLANLNQPSNSGYIEVNVATGSTPAILGAFLSFDGTNYKLFDGTSTVSVAGTVGAHKLGWYSGPDGMNLCVDGVWGTEAAYDATLAAALGVFTNATYPQQFRNFDIWATASQAAVDARMAA